MAAQIRSYMLLHLVKFDSPDGRTYWYKYYKILININCHYVVSDMLVNICLISDLNSFRLPTLIYF